MSASFKEKRINECFGFYECQNWSYSENIGALKECNIYNYKIKLKLIKITKKKCRCFEEIKSGK
jgi:hypothetical protein